MMKYCIIVFIVLLRIQLCAQSLAEQIEALPLIDLSRTYTDKSDMFSYFTITDTNLVKYRLPVNFKKPANWLKADEARKGSMGDWYGHSYSDTFDLTDALTIIDTEKELWKIGMAKRWCINNYQIAFPYLIARLGVKQKIGLENTADVIIWDRIQTGDLTFYGHGGSIDEDIFTVAGRCSWILNELTRENFAIVYGKLDQKTSEEYKQLWVKYLCQLKP